MLFHFLFLLVRCYRPLASKFHEFEIPSFFISSIVNTRGSLSIIMSKRGRKEEEVCIPTFSCFRKKPQLSMILLSSASVHLTILRTPFHTARRRRRGLLKRHSSFLPLFSKTSASGSHPLVSRRKRMKLSFPTTSRAIAATKKA